ncbi:MAG: TatD family hydrolase [Candidatus Sungiibacteriota bacterium]|uniref:TatD family hydrolase n=1 Tax=Candidatus Sungiibacteriota bacterium TaxID=2750080 RepID=A0A7T5RJS1_9BACT|nr:MAG: TatD family hydrolase [Candidatus Sungbacteria bacterium]
MSTPKLFDAHTHIQFAAFKDDADLVVKRALDAGIWMVNIGTQKDTSAHAVEMAQKYPEGVHATVGLHPIHTERSYHDPQELGEPSSLVFSNSRELENKEKESGKKSEQDGGFTSRGEEFDYEYYKKLAQDPKVVAIGECGLDYYRLGPETREKQKSAFLKQIELAHEVKKPLMIHCRNAFSDLIAILQTYNPQLTTPGVVHFFSGTKTDAEKLLDMGFSFTFGGVITFARDYDEVVQYIPLERIMVETDAPYVAPTPYRGKRNEPAYIIEVAKKVAELKNLSYEEVSTKTTQNALKIFGIQ